MDIDNPVESVMRSAGIATPVRHYYGDTVRVIFIAIAVLVGIAVPLTGNMEAGIAFGGPTIILLVVLAGLTHPHGSAILTLNAIVSAVGLFLAEMFAIAAYSAENVPAFIALEVVAVLFLAALYFSVKNVRALLTGRIGRSDSLAEFERE